jgi:copper homeostasis protein
MPGSGVSNHSIGKIVETLLSLGLKEIHMSGGEWVPGKSTWRRRGMGMGCTEEREWDVWKSSMEKIRVVRMALDTLSE